MDFIISEEDQTKYEESIRLYGTGILIVKGGIATCIHPKAVRIIVNENDSHLESTIVEEEQNGKYYP